MVEMGKHTMTDELRDGGGVVGLGATDEEGDSFACVLQSVK